MSTPDTAPHEREVLTPSALNRIAREVLERAFPLVWVEGEISNCARPASGHLYFTLKDPNAQVRCAMFRLKAMLLRFRLVDGAHVRVRARVSFYEGRGEFQLIVEHMEEAGEGALRREFERLKAALAAEGLFDAARKRPLPRYVRRIGIVTSPTGAAVRDVIAVLQRRFPLVEVEVMPVAVQGPDAAAQIVATLRAAGAARRHDVLLVTRGGGSLEDLFAFNDERLAREIARSPIPVVSAVGHEIDFTIADFVADLRAPTPSAAAELIVPQRDELARVTSRLAQRIAACTRRTLRERMQRLDAASRRLEAAQPARRLAALRARSERSVPRIARALANAVATRRARLGFLLRRLEAQHPARRAQLLRERLVRADAALRRLAARRLETPRRTLASLARALNAVGPLPTLERGYAILRDRNGRVVRSVAQAQRGDSLDARVADGTFAVTVSDGRRPE